MAQVFKKKSSTGGPTLDLEPLITSTSCRNHNLTAESLQLALSHSQTTSGWNETLRRRWRTQDKIPIVLMASCTGGLDRLCSCARIEGSQTRVSVTYHKIRKIALAASGL